MRKGETTRQTILDRAISLASSSGLNGLTIGTLADKLSLSKSGLFAHFKSKEALQIAVLESASQRFADLVVRPALQGPRGLPRIQTLLKNWFEWSESSRMPGGCLMSAASFELDDQPGPVRDRLVALQREWWATRVRLAKTAVEEGHFRTDLDCERFAQDLQGSLLAFLMQKRLLNDPKARGRCESTIARLLEEASIPRKK